MDPCAALAPDLAVAVLAGPTMGNTSVIAGLLIGAVAGSVITYLCFRFAYTYRDHP